MQNYDFFLISKCYPGKHNSENRPGHCTKWKKCFATFPVNEYVSLDVQLNFKCKPTAAVVEWWNVSSPSSVSFVKSSMCLIVMATAVLHPQKRSSDQEAKASLIRVFRTRQQRTSQIELINFSPAKGILRIYDEIFEVESEKAFSRCIKNNQLKLSNNNNWLICYFQLQQYHFIIPYFSRWQAILI